MIVKDIKFKVKGVTFKNEDNADIQSGIKKILNEYKKNEYFSKEDLYDGYTNKEIKEYDLNVSEYEGIGFDGEIKIDKYKDEDCVKIYIDTYSEQEFHIGYAPKEMVEEIIKYIDDENIEKYYVKIYITGGKYKHVEEDYEKEKVVIDELTYGFEVQIVFHDNKKIEAKTEKIEEKKFDDTQYYNQKANKKTGFDTDTATFIVVFVVFAIVLWVFFNVWNFLIS